VLNACRGWRFVEEGTWSAKSAAAAWARGRLEDPAGVDAALAARTTGEALDRAAVAAVVERVAARVDAELAAGVARRARAASP
jgi:hypothetical protein